MSKPKIYIAGKVTGLDYESVEKKFNNTERLLQNADFEPINPLKVVDDKDCNWPTAMKKCITALMTADAVLMLSDTHTSPGAKLEVELALTLKIPVYSSFIDMMDKTEIFP